MPLVSMRQLLDHAAENGYGLPAFNVNNLEQVQAIMEAASELDAPVIMQASAGARKYAGETFLKYLIQAAIDTYPKVPVVMHQDHGQSPDVCAGAIKLGFSSVMMDGSLMADGKTIADYDYNIDVTQQVVTMAHKLGITVEGELGCLGSLETMKGDKEDGHGTDSTMTREQLLTDPDQAADFVKKTQLDALAIAIGTSHGAYKFSRKPTGDILAIDRIKAIHKAYRKFKRPFARGAMVSPGRKSGNHVVSVCAASRADRLCCALSAPGKRGGRRPVSHAVRSRSWLECQAAWKILRNNVYQFKEKRISNSQSTAGWHSSSSVPWQ